MTQGQSWGEDLAKLRSHRRRAYDAAHQMAASLRAQVDPVDIPPSIAMLVEEISKARSLANQLSDRLHGCPLSLLLHGHQLSREAYYLLVALGVLGGGSYTGDPDADFQILVDGTSTESAGRFES